MPSADFLKRHALHAEETRLHAVRVLLESRSFKLLDEIYASRNSIVWKARQVDAQGEFTAHLPIAVKVYVKDRLRNAEHAKVLHPATALHPALTSTQPPARMQIGRELALFTTFVHPHIVRGLSWFDDDQMYFLLQVWVHS